MAGRGSLPGLVGSQVGHRLFSQMGQATFLVLKVT